jgi:hypothetical protein
VVHDLFLVQQGPVSESFRRKVENEMSAITADQETRDLLYRIAAGLGQRSGEGQHA